MIAPPAVTKTPVPSVRLTLDVGQAAILKDATSARQGSSWMDNSAKRALPIVSAAPTPTSVLTARLPSKSEPAVIASTVPGPPFLTRRRNRAKIAHGTAKSARIRVLVRSARMASQRSLTC